MFNNEKNKNPDENGNIIQLNQQRMFQGHLSLYQLSRGEIWTGGTIVEKVKQILG